MDWGDLAGPSRLETMRSAILLLKQWQESTFRLPLLENPDAFYREKEKIAKMLVDHHLGKLGRMVRMLGDQSELDSLEFLDDWAEIGFMVALWSRFDSLPDGLKLNLIYQSGPNITQKLLAKEEAIADHFVVVGLEVAREELLRRRSVYLYGEATRRYFLILDYAFNENPFERNYALGDRYQGTVIPYPFPGSLRISPLDLRLDIGRPDHKFPLPLLTVPESIRSFHALLQVNPFGVPFPTFVELWSDCRGGEWMVLGDGNQKLRISPMEDTIRHALYAACFRRPVQFVVLLTREGFRPLSYFNGRSLMGLDFGREKPE